MHNRDEILESDAPRKLLRDFNIYILNHVEL